MGGIIAGAFQAVFSVIFGFVANLLGTITGFFMFAAVNIFNFVTSPNFISLSYTNAGLQEGETGFNAFVYLGWTLTRDLTNIVFVIALVVIGLGTALRISGYQAQKALPTLIIIALLINFTPVILGLIIDASNIVTNFFIQGGFSGGTTLSSQVFGQWQNTMDLVGAAKFWDPVATNKAMSAAIGSMVLVFFNLLAALIYLLFALLFVIRYVALWILVILSPFAFASYILPATRQVWTMWWKQFIQWCLITVIATFFLYLADYLISLTARGDFKVEMEEMSGLPGLAPIFNGVLPYLIPLALLAVGLFASLSFAPKGADAVIKGGRQGIQRAGIMAARGYGRAMGQVARTPGRFAKGVGQYTQRRRAERITRGIGRPISPGLIMEEGMEAEDLRGRVTRPTVRQRVAGGAKEVARATAFGLKEAGFRDLKGKAKAAGKGLARASSEVLRASVKQKKDDKKKEGGSA
ncbi:MAG: hypothetical protein PHF07_01135 [Candidatus Pacebacteria bacterium]|jgi:hypothetical protein|nr:hypothetical protein [Candidatus Paceibacterota bacterium]